MKPHVYRPPSAYCAPDRARTGERISKAATRILDALCGADERAGGAAAA